MLLLKYLPQGTNFDFVGAAKRRIAYFVSAVVVLGSIATILVQGLNFGIDFAGGILLEVETPERADIAAMRRELNGLGIGEVALQSLGDEGNQVLIRVQRQEGGEAAQTAALRTVRDALGSEVTYRRTELVGPKIGGELIEDGIWAVSLALLLMAVYIWFRFEWHFAVGALVALTHDVIGTIGVFSLLQLEFNLTTVAALLTVAGYSINDTVVLYDRVRENLRRYKTMPLPDLLNRSVNDVLARTLLTSGTTLLAVLALFFFGGLVLKGFSFALIWGILIGTYSSVYVAMALLLHLKLRPEVVAGDAATEEQAAADEEPTRAG